MAEPISHDEADKQMELRMRIYRRVWWLITVILLLTYGYVRWPALTVGKAGPLDLVLAGTLIAVWLLPLASEVKVLGFEIKKEVHALKKEVAALQQTIMSASSAQANPSVHVNFDATLLETLLNRQGAHDPRPDITPTEPAAPPLAEFAFRARFAVHKELGRILKETLGDKGAFLNGFESIVELLTTQGVFSTNLAAAVRQVLVGANSAIHGRELAPDEEKILREGVAFVLDELRLIRAGKKS